jgi:phage terminase small subunit
VPILKNSKHEMFAHGVAKGVAAYQAYIDAGYAENGARFNASRLITKDNVRLRIDEIKENIEKAVELKVGISKAWIIEKLKQNLDRAMQEVEVLDHDGKGTGEFRYEGNVANKALELMGKELGMYQGRDPEGNPGNPNIPSVLVRHIGTDN